MTSNSEEVLHFLLDFEASSREYLKAKGICENEVPNAQLELKWKFLHTILRQNPLKTARRSTRRGIAI